MTSQGTASGRFTRQFSTGAPASTGPTCGTGGRIFRRAGRRTCYHLPVPIRGWRLGLAALAVAAVAIPTVAGSGSASVLRDACTTPVFQNGLDVVFGRASTQAAADRITRKATGVGFQGVKTVRDTCRVWKSALRGINSYDVAVGVQSEARRVRLFPTVECERAQEIGQFQAIFGTRRTVADLQSVIDQASSKGYIGIKTKTAPCGGYQAYVTGFSSQAEAQDFALTATQRTGLKVFAIKA